MSEKDDAQKEYELTDSLPTDFSYDGDVNVVYQGEDICSVSASGTSLSIDKDTGDCDGLGDPVENQGDWLMFEYTVNTPSLDLFITSNLTVSNYTFPTASLDLVS